MKGTGLLTEAKSPLMLAIIVMVINSCLNSNVRAPRASGGISMGELCAFGMKLSNYHRRARRNLANADT